MPLFISDEELSRLSNDAVSVAAKADVYIRKLQLELQTTKASAHLTEVMYTSLSEQLAEVEVEKYQLQSKSTLFEKAVERLLMEVEGLSTHIERLSMELSELRQSNRQSMDVIDLMHIGAVKEKEARFAEIGADLAHAQAACAPLLQEISGLYIGGSSLNSQPMCESRVKGFLVQEYITFLNTASKTQLKKKQGIGDKTATFIIELRENNKTPFKTLEDLFPLFTVTQLEGMIKSEVDKLFSTSQPQVKLDN